MSIMIYPTYKIERAKESKEKIKVNAYPIA